MVLHLEPWTLGVRSQTLAPKAETLPQKAQDPDWSLRVKTFIPKLL